MSNTKKSILVYLDNYPMVTALPPDQRGWLFTALMEYGSRLSRDTDTAMEQVAEAFPQMDGGTQLVFGFMATNIFRDTRRWLSRQRSAASSPRPRKSMAPGPVPAPTPEDEKKIREEMERTRRLLEQNSEETGRWLK